LIIGEVDPENIIILDEGKPPYHPDRSSGMDSNWIIRHIMGGSDRNIELAQKLLSASDLIDKEKYDKAEKITNEIYEEFGDFEELIKLKTKIDRIRLLADEIHKKTKKRTKKS